MAQPKYPLPIDEVVALCVDNVSQRILPELMAADNNIKQLGFMFGHPQELKNTIKELSEDATTKYKRFPVVMLFADLISSPSSVKGAFGDTTVNIVIAMTTEPTLKANERIAKNFAPILRPIYQELINQFYRCGYFWVQTPRQLLGRDIERLFWGRAGIQGNDKGEFDDCIDAIEIKGLKLTQAKKGNAFSQNTFMQFIEYFLEETRATLTVGSVVGNAITNPFFLKPITEIDTQTQVYIAGVDFTQTLDMSGNPTGEIVGITIEFFTGEIIIAKR
jgi:hypothetical protein